MVYHVPHRDLTAETLFEVLSSGNGTALTLSDTHMVYITAATGPKRVPVEAHDIRVRRCPCPTCQLAF